MERVGRGHKAPAQWRPQRWPSRRPSFSSMRIVNQSINLGCRSNNWKYHTTCRPRARTRPTHLSSTSGKAKYTLRASGTNTFVNGGGDTNPASSATHPCSAGDHHCRPLVERAAGTPLPAFAQKVLFGPNRHPPRELEIVCTLRIAVSATSLSRSTERQPLPCPTVRVTGSRSTTTCRPR